MSHTHAQADAAAPVGKAPALQRACACGEAAGVSGKCAGCEAEERLGVQPKLSISRPGDRWEQEADRIADQVVSDRTAPLTGPLPVTPLVQRQPEEEEEEELLQPLADGSRPGQVQRQPEEEEEELLQSKTDGSALSALQRQAEEEDEEEELLQPAPNGSRPDQVQRQPEEEEEELLQPMADGARPVTIQRQEEEEEEEALQASQLQRQEEEPEEEEMLQTRAGPSGRSTMPRAGFAGDLAAEATGGAPLDRGERSYFEPRFGRDLSGVRLHRSPRAAALSRQINARAFTHGNHIFFGAGERGAGSAEARRLMAHELTHTIQQTGGNGGLAAPSRRGPGADLIFRAVISNCNEDEQTAVEDAVAQATTNLGTAITALSARPLSDTTKAALFLAFRSDSTATADTVKDAYEEIRSELPTDGFSCRHEGEIMHAAHCGETTRASASYATQYLGIGDVSICIPNFTDMGELAQANTIVHESSHRHQQTADEGYFAGEDELESGQTAGLSPSDRLNNADSYAAFIHYVSNVAGGVIEARARGYRGGDLALEQSVAGPIDLNGADPEVPLFSITGIPANSGFAFRWIVDIDGDRWRMWSDSGSVFRWSSSSTAYINTPSRRGIAAAGHTSGRVLCRMRPWRGAELAETTLLERPVRFTS